MSGQLVGEVMSPWETPHRVSQGDTHREFGVRHGGCHAVTPPESAV